MLVERVLLLVLCLTSFTGLYISATTLWLVPLEAGPEPDVVSMATARPGLPGTPLPLLQDLPMRTCSS